jgi:hypothetical protein
MCQCPFSPPQYFFKVLGWHKEEWKNLWTFSEIFDHGGVFRNVQLPEHTPSVPKYLSRLIFYINFNHLFY